MSRIRRTGSERQFIVKKNKCDFCVNDKMHWDGIKAWCTKCKKVQKLKVNVNQIEKDRKHKEETDLYLRGR